ncbi:MAG: sulfoxide reductase heme-binding subunit YedZ [Gammaproteobacteria bacterium]|nr:sulfoxide reductase heme-binding subunit YedZ [Gammaproteobacteria bacterium]MDH5240784.1 sulfoxide reductase heme-binding subunit YedZ [Gammaproteobacteria bacterium]MDH5262825.1 sulfoxide reductase heme-binding subunit YedZ [Gammaproteobacteria bacterium]MDH5583205.1 sulfoxide reductase heme-binding subunit YedZ [Gammaproteobacteria bacterium]
MNTLQTIRYVAKPLVFVLCLLPAVLVLTDAFDITGGLGANPIEAIQDRFGNWALRFIMITLAVTPLRRLTGWNWLSRFRRMLGLFTFFYALMHFLAWLILDRELHVGDILEDLTERPFITLGFTAVVLLTALAITSFTALRRRMGRHWQSLHNAIYVIAILGVWHYWWQVKKDITEPLIYAVILTALLGIRLFWRLQRNTRLATAKQHP